MKTSTLVSFFGCLCVSVVSIAAETQDSNDASADSALLLHEAKRKVHIFRRGMAILQAYHQAGELLREEVPLDFKTLSSLTPVFDDFKLMQKEAQKLYRTVPYDDIMLKLKEDMKPLEPRLRELMGQKRHRRFYQIMLQEYCRQAIGNKSGLRTPLIIMFQAGIEREKWKDAEKVFEKEFEEYVEKRRNARLEYLEEIAAVLPEEKKKKIKELIGDPIDWQDPTFK